MTREEKERKAQEYVDRITAVNMGNALHDMRMSQVLFLTKNGKFTSSIADQYRDKLIEYGIYCKEEEIDRWIDMCQRLIDSIPKCSDAEWLYDAWTIEAAAELMQVMDGETIDWDKVGNMVFDQGHTVGTMSEVSQLLIAYSPNGMAFVDEFIKPRSIFNSMTSLKNAYNTERGRLLRKEKKERKEFGGRLVKILSDREICLRNQGDSE